MVQSTLIPSVLEIHLLGPFRVAVDGTPISGQVWTRRKPALLIKLLALQPHHQLHREQLMEVLWPNAEPEAAANNLHKVIHQARRALEPALASAADSHFILTQGQRVLLRSPGRLVIDSEDFDRLATDAVKNGDVNAHEEALAIYKGDLLVEDLYEDWVAVRREQFRDQRLQLIASLAALHEQRGEYPLSVERLKELLICDATNEVAHRNLIRLFALAGNKHQALRQYQLCREILRRELDAEPEPATSELYEQIMAGTLQPLAPAAKVEFLAEQASIVESIAVLPLANNSDDPGLEYLSDGLTETIINILSRMPGLRVMARDTVFRYKGRDTDARSIGHELGIRSVLTGRVAQFRDNLIVGAELVSVADGAQLWGERYNRNPSDIIALQEEMAREICEKLRPKLSHQEKARLSKRDTENPEAYRLYLKGRYFLNRISAEDQARAIDFFHQALSLDNRYAAACAGLAEAYTIRSNYRESPLVEKHTLAKSWATKAIELDHHLAEAHNSLAAVILRYEWDRAGAEREFKRAIELNPNYATAHLWYSSCLIMTDRREEAVREAITALNLDPVSLPVNLGAALVLYHAGRHDEAIQQVQKAVELDCNFFPARALLGLFYAEQGEHAAAIREGLRAIDLQGRLPELLSNLAYIYALAGKMGEAQSLLDELSEQQKAGRSFDRAMVYIGLEDNDNAFDWLERAYDERDVSLLFLEVARMFDPIRSDDRFKDLLRRVKFAR